MAVANLLDGLEPRSVSLTFAGKELIIRELPLYQRNRVIKILMSAALKVAGAAQQIGKDGLLQLLASRDMEQIISTFATMLGEGADEIDKLCAGILANVENARSLGLASESDLYCPDAAIDGIFDLCSRAMTTRMQIAIFKAYADVEGLGDLLGNLTTLPDRVESLIGSEETTD